MFELWKAKWGQIWIILVWLDSISNGCLVFVNLVGWRDASPGWLSRSISQFFAKIIISLFEFVSYSYIYSMILFWLYSSRSELENWGKGLLVDWFSLVWGKWLVKSCVGEILLKIWYCCDNYDMWNPCTQGDKCVHGINVNIFIFSYVVSFHALIELL